MHETTLFLLTPFVKNKEHFTFVVVNSLMKTRNNTVDYTKGLGPAKVFSRTFNTYKLNNYMYSREPVFSSYFAT